MADDDLKQFLRDQARSLDSLLELTPAKNMFGEDVSDQWKRRKQTPEEKKAARLAKLDPANWKSAKDVYDERSADAAKKRKREEQKESTKSATHSSTTEASDQQQPPKKQKTNDATAKPVIFGKVGDLEAPEEIANKNLRKKMKKRAHRVEKNRELREQKQQRKVEKAAQRDAPTTTTAAEPSKKPDKKINKSTSTKDQSRVLDPIPAKAKNNKSTSSKRAATELSEKAVPNGNDGKATSNDHGSDAWSDIDEETSGFDQLNTVQEDEDEIMQDANSTAASSEDEPEILSPPQDSAASSVSSILPPATILPLISISEGKKTAESSEPSGAAVKTQQSEVERLAARQRLQEQISQFRSQRKADDRPVRSRAELLEQRRRTEAERKAAKKEQKKKTQDEKARLQDEEMTRRFSPGGSGSLLASPRSPIVDSGMNESFTFGRIAFEDGTQLDPHTLSAVANKKQKGASDPASALKAAQAKTARIAGLDQDKQQDIQEKDMWLNARKRAHGERVKDDTSLLKKALKRQEKQKQKSGKDWDSRIEGVQASQFAKQKKRTDNLQKRKDEKSSKNNKKSGKPGKKVKRPGFEGSFKGRTGKGKKS